MNDTNIALIVEELARTLKGGALGKVFQLARAALAIDFRTAQGGYLFISVEPNQPRVYLIRRTARELEKQSLAPTLFALALRKHLSGARLASVMKDAGDRIVRLAFDADDAPGGPRAWTVVAQLTGRASNLLLLDAGGRIVDALRAPHGEGQEIGDIYKPPQLVVRTDSSHTSPTPTTARGSATQQVAPSRQKPPPFMRGTFATLSEAADDYYSRLEASRAFDARAGATTARLRQAFEKRRKLRSNLARDLASCGDADEHKRAGDLLLANIANAVREGGRVRLTDYYADDAPTVELEISETRTLPEEAAFRFARYGKARRAAQEISARLEAIDAELGALETRRGALEKIVAARDVDALAAFDGSRADDKQRGGRPKRKQASKAEAGVTGARRYRSSDGYEILVGRGARDNDQLTFRVARPHDLWLHAADYPGSHVIVRNQKRGVDVPHRTVIEAAQLAANYSHAKRDAKVAVNYTERKFVSKPKGAAPGLVRLASFRTLLVEPGENVKRVVNES